MLRYPHARRPISAGLRTGFLVLALIAAACTSSDATEDTAEPTASIETTVAAPAETTTKLPPGPEVGPVAAPVRHPATARPIYFVMPDRFENGDPTNDTGGIDGGPLDHGFLPTDRGFHHGGDLAGLTARLDYLEGLGVGAIWITPPFTNRAVQGNGTIEGSSSGYHGYWQIDWDRVDPHLGTEAEMQAFIAAAHDRDLEVYFDVVINHTGDVISFAEDSYVYYSTSARPFRDADGVEFDPADVAGAPDFPELDPAVSFAYTPTFASPDLAEAKSPAWLNDVTLYHNRGDSTFQGESSIHGDFFGLDDLFTEHPRVVEGMTQLHGDLIERYGIDGFRIDTMKHVNIEFWEHFAPAIRARAAELGDDDFFFFGEIVGSDPILQSAHTNLGVPATLDFIVDAALERYVGGSGQGAVLAQAFDDDDWFTDADNNASMQVTTFGNHDHGRMGYLVDRANPGASEDELLIRMRLGFDLLFLVRGQPVVYYGDEQGFVGTGGDQLARQSMFRSVTPEYVDDDNVGSDETPADDNFDTDHPLYTHVASLTELRRQHPTFVTGAMIVHETPGPTFGFSRIDRDERVEYLVVTNANESLGVPTRLTALSRDTTFESVAGVGVAIDPVTTDAAGEVLIEVPPLSAVVLRATTPLPIAPEPPTISIVRPDDGGLVPTERYRIEARVEGARYAEVTFAYSVDGAAPVVIGTDDNPPYRVYWNNAHLPGGTDIEIIATVEDGSGRWVADRTTATIGDR